MRLHAHTDTAATVQQHTFDRKEEIGLFTLKKNPQQPPPKTTATHAVKE